MLKPVYEHNCSPFEFWQPIFNLYKKEYFFGNFLVSFMFAKEEMCLFFCLFNSVTLKYVLVWVWFLLVLDSNWNKNSKGLGWVIMYSEWRNCLHSLFFNTILTINHNLSKEAIFNTPCWDWLESEVTLF